MRNWPNLVVAFGVFLFAGALLGWLDGQRLILINDEGLYLEGGRSILAGALPYRDFFALTGPGVYWDVALFFRLFGVSLAAGRALAILDIALICTCLFWLVAQLGHRRLAAWLAVFQLCLVAGDSAGAVTVNHRWDSAAMSILSVCLLFQAVRTRRPVFVGLAGVAGAYAAWITPPVLLVLGVMLVWAFVSQRWAGAIALTAGAAAVSAIAVTGLAITGSIVPMIDHFCWTATRYSGANRFTYGAIIGGYRTLFSDTSGIGDFLFRLYLVSLIALPAIAPVAAGILLLLVPGLRRSTLFLALCALASVLACAPRLDVAHLMYAAPLSYALAAVGLAEFLPARLGLPLILVLSIGASTLALNAVVQRSTLSVSSSLVGTLVGQPAEIAFERDLERSVPRGASFFSYPYLPLAYFLTQGTNPSRYSYLQPGMMSEADESTVLNALLQKPPGTVLYVDVPPEAYLRLFPSSNPASLRMRRIESFLADNYGRDAAFAQRHPGYELLHLKTP